MQSACAERLGLGLLGIRLRVRLVVARDDRVWGFFREALRALCVHALAPTRKTISAIFSVLRRTSSVVLLGGLRCGSSIPGSSI